MEKVCFKTQKGPAAVGPYCTATIYGGMIFMSGMIGVNPQTGKAPEAARWLRRSRRLKTSRPCSPNWAQTRATCSRRRFF